jgi:complex iron-sulfur molybdoenzyme family reductase subunit gamma
MTASRRFWVVLLVALVAAVSIRLFDVEPAVAQSSTVVAWHSEQSPGLDPNSSVWDAIPTSIIQMTAQRVTPPMSEEGAPWVMIAALHHDDVLYVNLKWVDTSSDTATDAVGIFSDAVAIQFPAVADASVPAICMGQADSAVNIWHWRADSQNGIASVPGRGYVDTYPEVDELHYPAAAASNPMFGAPAVQNLVAGGFGTVTPLESQVISGSGSHADTQWSVTMARPFGSPGELQPEFQVGGAMDVALAVWDGARDDRNGQKSVSAFLRMEIAANAYQGAGSDSGATDQTAGIVVLASITVLLMVIFGILATRRPQTDADGGADGGGEVHES